MLIPWLSKRMIWKSMQRIKVLVHFSFNNKNRWDTSLTFLWILLGLLRCSSNEVHTSGMYLWEQNQTCLLVFTLINWWQVLFQLRDQDLSFSFSPPNISHALECFFMSEEQVYSPELGLDTSVSLLCFLLQTLSLWEPSKWRFLTERGT